MRFSLRVFCTLDPTVTRAEVATFVEDGLYFDPDPDFTPGPELPEAEAPDWDALRVDYASDRGPLVLRRVTDPARAAEDVANARAACPGDPLAEALDRVARVFVLTLDEEEVGDSDAWALADDLAHWLAEQGSGVIHVPGMELEAPAA
jgi:hypothetical protein